MKYFILVFLLFICWKIIKPERKLYDFNPNATIPLRGLLAIFIMFHHISLSFDFSSSTPCFNIFKNLGAPCVGVFFLLTGYGLAKSYMNKGNNYISGFLRRRFVNTLPEFIFLTILISIYFISFEIKTLNHILSDYQIGFPPLPNSWFMYAIIYIYLSFYLSAKISKNNQKITALIFNVLIFVYIIIVYKLNWGYWWYISIPAVILGYYIAMKESIISSIIKHKESLVDIVLVFILFYYMTNQISAKVNSCIMLYGIIIMTYICMRLYSIPNWKLLLLVGDISLNIYLIHGVWILFLKDFHISAPTGLLFVVTLSILTAYFMKQSRYLIIRHIKPKSLEID